MRLLLDTHVFLWYITGDGQLSKTLLEHIRKPENEVFLSSVSLWETLIKHQLGKLSLPESPDIYIPRQREKHLITGLPVTETHVAQLVNLPPIHRDPFDRMLICQALSEDLTLATVDRFVLRYPVNTLSAS